MNLAISNYPNQFLFKFDLPQAVIISIIIHLLLFFGDQLLKREMPKPTQDNFKFEAILLEQKVDQLKPSPANSEAKSEIVNKNISPPITDTSVPKQDSVTVETIKEKITENDSDQKSDKKPVPDVSTEKQVTPKKDETSVKKESVAQPKKQPPKKGEDDARNKGIKALNMYSMLFAQHVGKHKVYQKIAQKSGWQGQIILQVQLTGEGKLLGAKIRRSSGFKALDEEGLMMLKRAEPLPVPPKILANKTFTMLIPIQFALY